MSIRLRDRFRKSFQLEVFLAVTALVLFLSLSFIFLMLRFQHQGMNQDLENKGKLMAEILAHQSRLGLYSENTSMLKSPIDALFAYKEVMSVALYSANKQVVIEKERENPASRLTTESSGKPSGIEFLPDRIPLKSSSSVLHCRDNLLIWMPVMFGDTFSITDPLYFKKDAATEPLLVGYARIILGKKYLQEKLRRSIINIVGIGLGFLLVSAVISFLMARRIHRPIQQLADGVRRFEADGECGALPLSSQNEIGELAVAFQEMIDSLQKNIQKQLATTQELAHAKNLAQLGIAVSKVTHEVGNLLNNMEFMTSTLKTETLSDQCSGRIQLLEKEAHRVRAFITDFLQFAKKPVLRMQALPVDLILKEVITAHESRAKDCGIRFVLDWPEALPPVSVDRHMLYQAFNNLVKNSLEAIKENGTITISGRTVGQKLIVTIADTGPGIEKASMDRLFEPFYTTKGRDGTGLGLSIVEGIVQAHNGNIFCDSNHGNGVRFVMQFPIQQAKDRKY